MVMKWLLFRTGGCRVLTRSKCVTGVLFILIYVTRLRMCAFEISSREGLKRFKNHPGGTNHEKSLCEERTI